MQNFANGGHREIAIMTLHFLSSYLVFRKKSKFIFAKFREWWPLRNCHHDTSLSFVLLGVQKKVEIHFCKISRMVTIAKLPSWHSISLRHSWRLIKSRNSFLQIFANGSHHGLAIITTRLFFLFDAKIKKKLNFWKILRSHHELTIMTTRFFRLTWRKLSLQSS